MFVIIVSTMYYYVVSSINLVATPDEIILIELFFLFFLFKNW